MKLASLLDDGTPGYLWSYLQDFSHYEALTAKDTLDQGSPVKDEQRQDCKSVKEVRRYKYYKHIQNHLEKDQLGSCEMRRQRPEGYVSQPSCGMTKNDQSRMMN